MLVGWAGGGPVSDRSIFDHRTISSALNEAFERIKGTNLSVTMAVSGRDTPYIFSDNSSAKFYANGLAVDFPNTYCVVPYSSILYVEVTR